MVRQSKDERVRKIVEKISPYLSKRTVSSLVPEIEAVLSSDMEVDDYGEEEKFQESEQAEKEEEKEDEEIDDVSVSKKIQKPTPKPEHFFRKAGWVIEEIPEEKERAKIISLLEKIDRQISFLQMKRLDIMTTYGIVEIPERKSGFRLFGRKKDEDEWLP